MQIALTQVTMHDIAVHWDGEPQPDDDRLVYVECPDDYEVDSLTAEEICEDQRVMLLRWDDVRLMDVYEASQRILDAVASRTLFCDERSVHDRDPALNDFDGVVNLDADGVLTLTVPEIRERSGVTEIIVGRPKDHEIAPLVRMLAGQPVGVEELVEFLGVDEARVLRNLEWLVSLDGADRTLVLDEHDGSVVQLVHGSIRRRYTQEQTVTAVHGDAAFGVLVDVMDAGA